MSLKNTDVRTPGAQTIAKKWNLPLTKVYALISQGAKVEFEHNRDKEKAKQVARDHINERPDYYKRLKHMERLPIRMKEETITADVRGFGNVTGDPAVGDNSYVGTNMLAKDPMNGALLKWMKNYSDGHNKVGFKEFDPTLKEGLSTDPERDSETIGDYTGASRKVMKVDEITISPKMKQRVKKAVAAGVTAANLATYGQVAGDAAEGRGNPVKSVIQAASGLPGKTGWGAMGVNYTIKGFEKAREHLRGKNMEEQGSPANPARYTERPMYERRNGNNLSSGEVDRGIYEDDAMKNAEDKIKAAFTADKVKDMFKRVDKQRDKDPKWVAYKKRKEQVKEEQIDEISAELVGKVSNARFWRGEAPSKTLTRAINKKFIESEKPVPKKKKEVKEDIADKDWDDTTGKKLPEEQTKKDVALMGNQKPDAWDYGAKGTTKTIHEETKMDTKELINEALDDILENNLVSMKENFLSVLQEKTMEKLEEKKKEIAANYFAQ